MALYIQVLLQSVAFLFIILVILQVTGYLLHRTFLARGPGHHALFAFHGLLFWVCIFAQIISAGKSILWVICFYFIVGAFTPPIRSRVINLPNGFITVIRLWLFTLIPFTIFYLFTFRYTNTFTLPFMDEVFYSKVALLLSETGVETNLTQGLWFENFLIATPYHYFELWLTTILQTTIPTIPVLFTFKLLTIPLLIGISLEHIFQTARSFNLSTLEAYLVAISILFTGLFLGYTSMVDVPIKKIIIIQLHYISDFIVLNRTKLATVLLFMSAAGLLYVERNKYWSLPLVSLAFLWVTVMPHVLLMVAVGLLGQHRQLFNKQYIVPSLYTLLSLLVFWFFYISPFHQAVIDNSVTFFHYRHPNMLIGTFVFEIITHLIILFPVLLLSIWMYIIRKEAFNTLILLLSVPILVGIVLHTVSVGAVNSYQFVNNLSSIALPLIFCYTLIAFLSKHRKIIALTSVAILWIMQGYFTYLTLKYSYENYQESYSIEFIDLMKKHIDKEGNRVVTLFTPKGGHHDAPFTNYDGTFFLMFDRRARICQLNAELAQENMSEKNFELKVLDSPFLYFCRKHSINDYSKGRLAFVHQMKPDFLVVNAKINIQNYPELEPLVEHVATDWESGTKVYKFKFEN